MPAAAGPADRQYWRCDAADRGSCHPRRPRNRRAGRRHCRCTPRACGAGRRRGHGARSAGLLPCRQRPLQRLRSHARLAQRPGRAPASDPSTVISVAAPLWLLGLAVGPLLWWLHRARGHGRSVAVASILLFRDVPAPRSGGPRAPVTDPAWWRRVASVVLLTLALAGLTLHGPAREVIVWIDDGPSMATREAGGTRPAAGFAALRRALPHDPTTHIELRSLAEPGLRYEANQLAPLVRSREARVPASG